MKTRVQRWGNSLALRIPKSFAEEVGLTADSPVDLRLSEGSLIVEPVLQPPPVLEDLLSRVQESNLHAEIDTGLARGGEIW